MANSSPDGAVRGRNTPAWRKPFLSALAESSNISAAARKAKVPTSRIYKLRREDAGFRSAWFDALCEGYDVLEMSMLHRLRIGELEGTKAKARRKFDNATAFRLLCAHREAVSQQKAIREDEDEDAVLASINTRLDAVRAREKAVQLLIGQTNASPSNPAGSIRMNSRMKSRQKRTPMTQIDWLRLLLPLEDDAGIISSAHCRRASRMNCGFTGNYGPGPNNCLLRVTGKPG